MAAMRNQFRSEMHAVGDILDDVRLDFREDRSELAERKLSLWRERWTECLRGGYSPETFSSEVMELEAADVGAPIPQKE